MPEPTDDRAATSAVGRDHRGRNGHDNVPNGERALLGRIPRLGVWAWGFVGLVASTVIVAVALDAVSEIMLPLTFAAVLAVIFKPLVGGLERHRWQPGLAAGLVVLGLLAVATGVVVATVRGVTAQADHIGATVDAALDKAASAMGIDQGSLEAARAATEEATPAIAGGFLTKVVSGVGSLVGLASGVILGSLIMYYLLKDGSKFRRSVVAQFDPAFRNGADSFFGDSFRTLRDYGRARTVMSAIVAVVIGIVSLILGLPLVFTIVVVNFIGGYIPYIGAFLGGGLTVMVELGDGGIVTAGIMLVVVLGANLVLENFVEPKVMGRSLKIHPLIVLVVTALGGLIGGIVGLILAVPAAVIAGDALVRLRSGGYLEKMADRAEPAVRRLLD